MGNRSKFIALTAAAAAAVAAARRRGHLRLAAEGIGETILPTVKTVGVPESEPAVEEGQAPGHRHLPVGDVGRTTWRRLRRRPRVGYSPKERYPYAKD